ncbi:MAG: glycosyltransferase [Planctomycetota bacterium]|nr:MAG: glycosyltransferase [Planctomycetota bacterium]
MAHQPEVSLIIPVYNEEENLAELLDQIRTAMAKQTRPWEVLLVDDGSRDGSWPLLQRLCAEVPEARGLRLQQNRGQTAAFAAGFRAAQGRLLVTLDADLQNDPADIPMLLQRQAQEQADAVLGIRRRRNDNWIRRWSSKIANAYRRRRTQDDTIDTGCSLKVFQTQFVRDMPLFTGMHRFLPTLARMQGAQKIVQIEVNHRPRLHGVSKYGVWNRLWVGLADVKAVRWMQRRHLNYQVAEEIGGDTQRTQDQEVHV